MIPGDTSGVVYLYYAGTDRPAVMPTVSMVSSTGYEQDVAVRSLGAWQAVLETDMPGYFWVLRFGIRFNPAQWSPVPVTVIVEIGMSDEAVGRVNILLDYNS
jgi:hypothetical protein